jgi:hypothetical protein
LLRLLVESDNSFNRAEACLKLLDFLTALKVAHEHYGWDLAQLCIETCGPPIEKIASADPSTFEDHRASTERAASQTRENSGVPQNCTSGPDVLSPPTLADPQTTHEEIPFPVDLDIPWDYLWDDIAEPFRFVDTHHGVV